MRTIFSPDIKSLLDLIADTLEDNQELHIVGGAVRDALLGRKIKDLDFAMPDNPTSLAKRIARCLNVGFFVLDDVRHTARVLYQNPEGEMVPLDFVSYTGEHLEEDLRNRDFTINAMAISLRDIDTILDPLGGQADLAVRCLRSCSEHALLDDPVRVLRGIRLALQYGLEFSVGLVLEMRTAAGFLTKTSFERQRDEFFKILEGPMPEEGLQLCQQLGVFEALLPSLMAQDEIPASRPHVLPLIDHTFSAVKSFYEILSLIDRGKATSGVHMKWMDEVVAEFSRYSNQIADYFQDEITPGRTKRGLALFGTLLHDIGKPSTMTVGEDGRFHFYGHAVVGAKLAWDAARRLQLSNAEANWVESLVRQHMDLLPLVNGMESLSRKKIFHFYKKAGETGVSIALLSLADTLATYGQTLSCDTWRRNVEVTRDILTAWFDHRHSIISPALLLDGNDLQARFGLSPGKQIGQLLDALTEAQAIGEVTNQEEAESFIRVHLQNSHKDRDNESPY